MKLNFNEIFSHNDNCVTPKFNIKYGDIVYKNGEKFSDCNTVFGVAYKALLSHDFELISLPEGGYEIKAYYVR
ncbi:hypothetical protein GCM10023091_03280 [Ravibacter arvi]|uniref:Uncharacterized protein n=1 Tax=Ravibacter arvi TaxID=2051041 RepID=A0ABP8LLV4_9BACT